MGGYTLISSIGTGMYKKEGGYRDTVYQFPDGKKYETKIFLKAVLETKYRPIKKVILIGTTSSSWDVLIPSDTNFDFWSKILGECEKNAFSDESKKELESKLSKWYNNIKFEIVVHTNEFKRENVKEIFDKYLDIPDLLERETNILFDITHGFRSMPLLIFQSLQLNASKIYGKKVELIYGEYIEEEKISYVRDLSEYWNYYEISSAIKQFDDKLNGRLLAVKIKEYWPSGAESLKKLSDIVEFNFSLHICEALKKIKVSLDNYSEEGKPQWVNVVRDKIAYIYKKLKQKDDEKYPVAKTVWEFSNLLFNKKLITQSVIAKQVAIETAVTEKMDKTKIGDYDWLNTHTVPKGMTETPKQLLNRIRNLNEELRKLTYLEHQRNQIAHGGVENKGKFSSEEKINNVLSSSDWKIKEFFAALDMEK
jgi:CRISPR-associated Csx2 family protein